MPGINGIQTSRKIRLLKRDLLVILSSVYQEFQQDLGTWAAVEYVVKSSDFNELKRTVRKPIGEMKA